MTDPIEPLRIIHGTLRDTDANAFAVVRDEAFYIRSFLDHHRGIGIEQFLIVDDRSSDGTRELLAAQPDVVVLDSPHRYGEVIALHGPGGERRLRAGIAFKTLVPQRYLRGRYAACLDADEYLVLPQGVATFGALVEILGRNDVSSVPASLVDFFPATVAAMELPCEFPTAETMLAAHPWFDAVPLVGLTSADAALVKLNENASARLFRKHGVKAVPERMRAAPRWLNRLMPYKYPVTTVSKMPIVRWDPHVEYLDSHRTNVPPSDKVLVGLAHLKFTYDLARRVAYALESKAYVRGSRKYQWYEELLDSMRKRDPSFLGPRSRQYRTPADFAAAKLTSLDLS